MKTLKLYRHCTGFSEYVPDNHPDSTKIYKKIQRTCTPRCLKQPCGRIELVHVKQVNPEYKKTHKNYSEKQYKTHKDQIIPTWNRCKIVVELTSFLGSTAPGKIALRQLHRKFQLSHSQLV
jgi:hypothetical protein